MYFLLQLSTHLTASLVFCLVIHIKFFRDKPVSVHSLRSTTPSSPHNKKKEEKKELKSGTKWESFNTVPILDQHGNQGVLATSVWLEHTTWVVWDYESYSTSVQQKPRLHHTPTDKETFQTEVTTSACLPLSSVLKLGQSLFFCSAAQVFNRCDWKLKLTLDE